MFATALPLVIITCLISVQQSHCEVTWILGQGTNTEYLINNSLQKRNFNDSNDFCRNQGDGASLPMILTQQEQDNVVKLITNYPNSYYIWLGAKNVWKQDVKLDSNKKAFLWLDGNKMSFTNWFNPPFNPQPGYDSVVMRINDGKWMNQNHFTSSFSLTICERPIKSNDTWKRGPGTGNDYLVNGDKNRNFKESNYFCQKLGPGSRLPVIMNQREQDSVFNSIVKSAKLSSIWLGARSVPLVDRKRGLIWSDGSKM